MSKGSVRDGRKERQWRRWLEEWRESGLSVRGFCRVRGLAEANFYAWRRTLAERSAEAGAFVPVRVVSEEVPTGSALELVLPGQRQVRIAPGFDATTLQRLLTVLEGRPC